VSTTGNRTAARSAAVGPHGPAGCRAPGVPGADGFWPLGSRGRDVGWLARQQKPPRNAARRGTRPCPKAEPPYPSNTCCAVCARPTPTQHSRVSRLRRACIFPEPFSCRAR
jgi:hypothetical protein